jgi:hypothetical protein
MQHRHRLCTKVIEPDVSGTTSRLTLMVCTVLTGTLLMAREPNICPPTWKAAMGKVPLRMARVGLRSRPVHPSSFLLHTTHNPATNANWTIVSVTGKRKLLRMTLPVLLDIAELEYQSVQSETNLIVE